VLERLLDVHLAQIAALLSNRFRGKHGRFRKAKEFLLLPQVPKPPMTGELMLARMIAANAAFGGETIDKRGND